MQEYTKIQTIFKRDPNTKYKTLLMGEYSTPELKYLKDNTWLFTEKVDGTNIRVTYRDGVLTYHGRSDNSSIPSKLLNNLVAKFSPMLSVFEEVFGNASACLYGEGHGAGIEKGGGNYGPEQDFVLFDVVVGDWWLRRPDVEDVASNFNIEIVPILGIGTLSDMVDTVRGGLQSAWGDFTAEGIVARPTTELFGRNGERVITKLKHRDFAGIKR